MILATGAKLRMLASESRLLDEPFEAGCRSSEEEGDEVDDMIARCRPTVSEALLQREGAHGGLCLVRGWGSESIGLGDRRISGAGDCGWAESSQRQSQHLNGHATGKGARKSNGEREEREGLTIGYGQPSVLFLDLDFKTLPLCIRRVHGTCGLNVLSWRVLSLSFGIALLCRVSRHVIFGFLQRAHGRLRPLCAGVCT